MKPKLSICSYRRTSEPVRTSTTKFGGQPNWLGEPTWPISAGWKTPMRFVCQILLEEAIFGDGPTKMAYLFLTQAERNEIENGAFDPDIIFPDEGENAVVIQPGGHIPANTRPLAKGPTLYDYNGMPCELTCELKLGRDQDYIPRDELSKLARTNRAEFDSYVQKLSGDKIGGTPLFGNNDSWPTDGTWSLLLQLLPKRRPDDPFYLNLGATLATGFAFVSTDKNRACFLVD